MAGFVFLLLLLLLLKTLLWLLLKISSLLSLLLLVKPVSSSSARLLPSDVPFSAAGLLLPAVASYRTVPSTQLRLSLHNSCAISLSPATAPRLCSQVTSAGRRAQHEHLSPHCHPCGASIKH